MCGYQRRGISCHMKNFLSILASITIFFVAAADAHVHLSVKEADSRLQIFVEDFFSGDFAPEIYPFRLPPAAMITYSQNHEDNGIGANGVAAWELPQTENHELLYLGWSSRLPSGKYLGNRTLFRLRSVSGPGDFYVYQVGTFGEMDVWMNSSDGIDETDVVEIKNNGGHEHCNWLFSRPGTYFVELQAEAQLAGSNAWVTSEISRLKFQVIMPETELSWISDTDGNRLQWRAIPGLTYQLQSSASLEASEWESIGDPISVNLEGVYKSGDIELETDQQKFFRLNIIF